MQKHRGAPKMVPFLSKNDENVKILLGDSSRILPSIITEIDKPTLFYLDAHYSGPGTGRTTVDSPLLLELKELLKLNIENYVILIDDVRHLGEKDYPTFSEIKKIIAENVNLKINSKQDIIRIES